MVCSKCSNPINPDDKFCVACGAPVEAAPAESTPVEPTPVAAPPVAAPPPVRQAGPRPEPRRAPSTPPPVAQQSYSTPAPVVRSTGSGSGISLLLIIFGAVMILFNLVVFVINLIDGNYAYLTVDVIISSILNMFSVGLIIIGIGFVLNKLAKK